MNDTIATLIRALLKIGGGALVAKGYASDETISEIAGAVVTIVGLVWGIVAAKKKKQLPASPGSQAGATALNLSLIACLLSPALLFVGCGLVRPVAPGNDPLIVRTEQFQTTAQATFLLTLQFDHSARDFWQNRAPAFHEFCEDLRTPTPYQITNTLPRYRVALLTLDDLKTDYKQARASSNALAAALASLQSLSVKAGAWLTIITNR